MEDNFSIETLDQPENFSLEKRQLPVFLKTIAILTFVGSFLSILSNVFTLITMHLLQSLSANISASVGANSFENEQNNFYSWTILYSYTVIFNCLLCSTGAILMLRRRVSGFWIYIASQIILLAAMILVSLATLKMMGGFMSILYYIVLFIIMIAFSVMYAVNKKHLGNPKSVGEQLI